ncbi:methyltransferase domain-containing protein [soil metagenome]
MTEARTVWDPALYERYKLYRDRPALDLLLRIPSDLDAREIWDLGCGTGEHAAILAARHPGARVHGLDSSPEMLALARKRKAQVEWIEGDVNAFNPAVPADLIFSNACLQWAAHHETLFPHLAGQLAPGGVFACQMPISFDTDWHRIMREVAAHGPWGERLRGVGRVRPTGSMSEYHDWLSPLCEDVDIWSTTYLHVLEGDDPVVEWMSGTGLRPYLQALDDEALHAAFLHAYRQKISDAFPKQPDGTTLFPFPRLFMVARRR